MERLFGALADEGVEYALVGGLAMNLHGLTRFTEDIDIFLELRHENVERFKRALAGLYDDPSVNEISAEELNGDYPIIRYIPPDGSPPIDIIGRLGDAVAFEDLALVTTSIGDTVVRLVSPATLYAMKADTVRPIDMQDAERLRRTFELESEEH